VCRAEQPGFGPVARAHEGEVLFFGIAWHGSQDAYRDYIREFRVPYDSGADLDESIFRAYGFSYQPATVFITRSGRIFRSHFGPLEREELDATVRKLLDEG
jgi:hypothetical protein